MQSNVEASVQLCHLLEQAVRAANEVVASMSSLAGGKFYDGANTYTSSCGTLVSAGSDASSGVNALLQRDEPNTTDVLRVVDLLLKASRLSRQIHSREKRTVQLVNDLSATVAKQAGMIKEHRSQQELLSKRQALRVDATINTEPFPSQDLSRELEMAKLECRVLKKKIDLQFQKVAILEDELNNSWDANKKLKRIVRKSHLVIQSQKDYIDIISHQPLEPHRSRSHSRDPDVSEELQLQSSFEDSLATDDEEIDQHEGNDAQNEDNFTDHVASDHMGKPPRSPISSRLGPARYRNATSALLESDDDLYDFGKPNSLSSASTDIPDLSENDIESSFTSAHHEYEEHYNVAGDGIHNDDSHSLSHQDQVPQDDDSMASSADDRDESTVTLISEHTEVPDIAAVLVPSSGSIDAEDYVVFHSGMLSVTTDMQATQSGPVPVDFSAIDTFNGVPTVGDSANSTMTDSILTMSQSITSPAWVDQADNVEDSFTLIQNFYGK